MIENQSILFVCRKIPPDYTGAGRACLKIAKRQKDQGKLYKIITSSEDKLPSEFEELEDCIIRISDKLYANKFTRIFSVIIKAIQIFGKLLVHSKNFEICHVFSTTWDSSIAIFIAKNFFKKKTILEITRMGGDNPTLDSNKRFNISRIRRKYSYKFADRIVCLSPQIYNDALNAKIEKKKLMLIPRSVNPNVFKVIQDELKGEKKVEIGLQSKINLVFVGSLIKRKGAHLIPEIVEELKKIYTNFTCYIIGNNPDSEHELELHSYYQRKIQENDLKEHLKLLGFRNNMEEYFGVSDFLLFPSSSEGLPNVVLEAMSCGTIPILRKVEGLSDYILGEYDFLSVDSQNPIMYSQLILDLINDQKKRENLSSQMKMLALDNFSESRIDQMYSQMYQNLSL